MHRRSLTACALVALCASAATAVPAAAKPQHKPVYAAGLYSGPVSQRAPVSVPGKIRFLVSRHTLTGLNLAVTELCGHIIWTRVVDAPKTLRLSIARDGSFAYDRTVLGDHLQIRGRLRGHQATGTLFDALTAGTLSCAMPSASSFAAQR